MKSIRYSVPIQLTENFSEGNDFIIRGIAISSTITDNGHLFKADELRNSAGSLTNRPLLMDHNASIDSMVGRVISSVFDEVDNVIRFEAKINDTESGKKVKELILAGDLNTVSVGANVEEIVEEDGVFIPTGVKFKELSLVATPADDNATFTKMGNLQLVLQEAYNFKSKSNPEVGQNAVSVDEKIKMEINMEKEENSVLLTLKEENDKFKEDVNAKIEAQANLLADALSKVDSLKESMDAEVKSKDEMKESIDAIKEMLTKLTESDKDESEEKSEESEKKEESEEKEEKKEEEKAEESNEKDEDEDEESDEDNTVGEHFKIVQGHKSFTIVKNKY